MHGRQLSVAWELGNAAARDIHEARVSALSEAAGFPRAVSPTLTLVAPCNAQTAPAAPPPRAQANFLSNYIPGFVDQKRKRFPRQTAAFLVDGASISSERALDPGRLPCRTAVPAANMHPPHCKRCMCRLRLTQRCSIAPWLFPPGSATHRPRSAPRRRSRRLPGHAATDGLHRVGVGHPRGGSNGHCHPDGEEGQ